MKDLFSQIKLSIQNGDLTKVKEFIQKDKLNEGTINLYDDMGHNALILSILHEYPDITQELLQIKNINFYQQGYLTGTALSLALSQGEAVLAERLITEEKPFQPEKHPDLWFCAVNSGSTECVRVLIKSGLNPEEPAKGVWKYHPAWVWRVEKEYAGEGLCFPLDEDSYFNDVFGKKPLQYAVNNEDEEMNDFLEKKIEAAKKISSKEPNQELLTDSLGKKEKLLQYASNTGELTITAILGRNLRESGNKKQETTAPQGIAVSRPSFFQSLSTSGKQSFESKKLSSAEQRQLYKGRPLGDIGDTFIMGRVTTQK